jgi:hypothetical protein
LDEWEDAAGALDLKEHLRAGPPGPARLVGLRTGRALARELGLGRRVEWRRRPARVRLPV